MKSGNLRRRLAVLSALLTLTTVAVFAAGTLFNVYTEQVEAADFDLKAEALRVLDQDARIPPTLEGALPPPVLPWTSMTLIERSLIRKHSGAPVPDELLDRATRGHVPRTVALEGGRWRVDRHGDAPRVLVLAYNLEEVDEIVGDLLAAYLLLGPIIAVMAGAGSWWLSGLWLDPVRRLAAAAERVTSANLAERVEVEDCNDEIGRLASVFNGMLGRLEASFRQAERFSADASHELRTPLTIMGGEIESWRMRGAPASEVEGLLSSLEEEISRMETIASSLLMLARLDAGEALLERRDLDLSTLVAELAEDADLLAESRGASFVITGEGRSGARLPGNEDLLRHLLLNLLDNAARYAGQGGRVWIHQAHGPDGAVLEVGNTGEAIPADAKDRLFERFFRADPVRGRGGHGLGLSLAREIARAHGGDVTLERSDGRETVFRVALPRSQAGP